MIVGLGTDLVEVERLRLSLERFGARFLDRVFTEEERRYCAGKKRPEESLAARFAAKEAGAKALGTGMSRGIGWHDLEVRRAAGGAPELLLWGGALALAEALGVRRAQVSLTHTERYASAVVIFEGTSPFGAANSDLAGALKRD